MRTSLFAISIEIVWLIFMAAFAAGCAYPVYDIIAEDFVIVIIMLAMLFAFYFRLVVFFQQVAWLRFLATQIILFLATPVVFIMVIGKIQSMIFLLDAHDLLYFITPGSDISTYEMNDVYHLFRQEFLLLAVGLLIVLALAEFRIALAFVKRIREME